MSAELTARTRDARADRLLEPRARGVAVRCAAHLAAGRGVAPAGPAAAARRLRTHRLLGLARRRMLPASPLAALPRPRATSSGSACSTVSSAASDERQHGVGWSMARLLPALGLQLAATACRCNSPERLPIAADQPDPPDHHRGRRAGARPQSLRPGRAGEPVDHPPGACSAWSLIWGYDLNLYTVRYHRHRRGTAADALPRGRGGADRAVVRARRAARRRLANPAVARRHLPVALAARDLRLFRGDGDPRDRASRQRAGTGQARS